MSWPAVFLAGVSIPNWKPDDAFIIECSHEHVKPGSNREKVSGDRGPLWIQRPASSQKTSPRLGTSRHRADDVGAHTLHLAQAEPEMGRRSTRARREGG